MESLAITVLLLGIVLMVGISAIVILFKLSEILEMNRSHYLYICGMKKIESKLFADGIQALMVELQIINRTLSGTHIVKKEECEAGTTDNILTPNKIKKVIKKKTTKQKKKEK